MVSERVVELTPKMVEAGTNLLLEWCVDSDEWYDLGVIRLLRCALAAGGFKVIEKDLKNLPESPDFSKYVDPLEALEAGLLLPKIPQVALGADDAPCPVGEVPPCLGGR